MSDVLIIRSIMLRRGRSGTAAIKLIVRLGATANKKERSCPAVFDGRVFRRQGRCQNWLKQRMDELEKTRHFIAHNRALLPSEYQRVYMYIADWNRVVGL